MPSPSQVADLRSTLDDVLTLAQRDITTLTAGIRNSTPLEATQALVADVPAVVQAWGDVASTVATDWYAETRPQGLGTYSPAPSDPAPAAQIEPMVRWAVGPLWTDLDWDKALEGLLAGSSRLVRQGANDTLRDNAWNDPESGAYVRVPRLGACAFCLMLASRGAVYRSRASAEVTGDGRGYHDHCRCIAVAAYGPDDYTHDPLFAANRSLAAEWQRATAGADDQFEAWKAHIAATRQ